MWLQTLTGLVTHGVVSFESGAERSMSIRGWTVVGGLVVFMVAVASFFEGLLRLHELLANPLDDQMCSWNVEDMIASLEKTSRQTACQTTRPRSCGVATCQATAAIAQDKRVGSTSEEGLRP